MTQTIVGLFNSVSAAQRALDRLAREGIVRTNMHVRAQDESSGRGISVTLREEHATIKRRAVDRLATEADLKERFVEIRETAEEAVVAKSARVVEEVVVGKESSQRTEAVNDTVRGTEVEVERDTGTPAKGSTDPLKKKPL